jgi:DNA-binding NarL/FixJ family response regulator
LWFVAKLSTEFDALEKAKHLNADPIILDIAMPRRNGLQTARELRSRMYRVAIILFTWYADAVQPGDAEEAGITAVISKSNPAALQSHVKSFACRIVSGIRPDRLTPDLTRPHLRSTNPSFPRARKIL